MPRVIWPHRRPHRSRRSHRGRRIVRLVALLMPTLLAAIALVLLFISPTGAQTTSGNPSGTGLATPSALKRDATALSRRIGLWASVGGGRGNAGLNCAACRNESGPAFTMHAAIGGRPHPRFHVGVETWAWLDVIGNGVDRTARGTQVIARHYPSARRRGFVTGGLGTSRFGVDDGDTRFSAASPALSIGGGWDVPFRGALLSPTLVLTTSTGGALRSDRTGNPVADNARLGFWRGTVAITWF